MGILEVQERVLLIQDFKNCLNDYTETLADVISRRTVEILFKNLYERRRDEISTEEICREFNISRETLRRRIKAGLLPLPQKKRGKNWFPRHVIEIADIKSIL